MTQTDKLEAVLGGVPDPLTDKPLMQSGRVSGLTLRDGKAGLVLMVDGLSGPVAESLKAKVTRALEAAEGVTDVRIIMTAERGPPSEKPAPSRADPHPTEAITLPNIKHIVAVASGKGGVGKSTVAANLAVALARQGLRVGLLDADIYGPSVPMLLGNSERAKLASGRIQPTEAHGIKAVSMGTMADPGRAVIWRGPMASSAMMQMLGQTDWGELDVLVLDLPPGTGDIQLTLAQKVPLSGAVIVSTPQDLALIDAKKAIAMFEKVNVPVLGMVENMSLYLCPKCGHEAHIFGHGGAADTARELEIAYLGGIPLDMTLREAGDAGVPSAARDDAISGIFATIAGALKDRLKGI